MVLCVENSDFRTKIAHLYGSKTSPVILYMQNSVPSIRITSLYGSQPSFVCFFHAKQRLYDQTNMVPGLICGFCMQNVDFRARIACLYGSQTSPVILCMQSACLASESLVSMGPRPHLWFWHAKHRLLDLNYNSLWVLDLNCHLVYAKQRD